ncbi:Gfo/Idh/MocA family oxidoreductase [Microvirga sp. BT689]|uniref:Gfo/Idh/MocA family protein n=1 Tax=Microvirga arvi TaxID=2778731 RepID=UPI00194DC864|nr:Gfo/Idh/MocA family oxidoreductase [Microvirga arvi]MBM6581889.1 Gfo/Idh/MocA family oxidoreductase [Microvirga arvi]
MRLLLVGLGNRGTMWADVVAMVGGAGLSGAMDVDPARLAAFHERYPAVPLHDDLDRAIAAGGHDAVLLVTPPGGHLDQLRRIFAAGLPVIAEKPLTVDLADAKAAVALSEQARLSLSVCLNFRYLPVSQRMREIILSGELGAVGMGQFVYQRSRDGMRPGLNRYPLTMRHPMMLEQSIHHFDLIRHCYGREVEAISCRTWNPSWSMYAHDSSVQCLLTLEGGIEVSYIGTWTSGWNEPMFLWRTDCAGGVVLQREVFSDLAVARRTDPAPIPVALPDVRAYYDDTAELLRAFIASRQTGAPPPCSGRDHLKTLALCFAAIESSQNGTVVDMGDFYARNGLTTFA